MKMKMKLTSGLLGVAALLIASHANAATIQVIPANPIVNIGQALELTVQGTGFVDGMNAAGIALTWEPLVLDAISTDTDIQISVILNGNNLGCDLLGCTVDAAAGRADVYVSVPLTLPPTPPNDPAGLGGATFDIFKITLLGLDSGESFANIGVAALGGIIDGNDQLITDSVIFSHATVTVGAVPVPAAVWLFGSGLIGLVGIARRRSSAIA